MNSFECCDYAAEKLKKAGFVLRQVARKTESCYYSFGNRRDVIRVSTHFAKLKGRKARVRDEQPVTACITFGTHNGRSQQAVDKDIYIAVGRYFLNEWEATTEADDA